MAAGIQWKEQLQELAAVEAQQEQQQQPPPKRQRLQQEEQEPQQAPAPRRRRISRLQLDSPVSSHQAVWAGALSVYRQLQQPLPGWTLLDISLEPKQQPPAGTET